MNILLVLSNLTANSFLACIVCVNGLFEFLLPPVFLWYLLPPALFLLNGIVAKIAGAKLPLQSESISESFIIVLVSLLCAATLMGPLATIPLALPPLLTLLVLARRSIQWRSANARRLVMLIGIFELGVLGTAVGYGVFVRMHRTIPEFIVQWHGAAIGLVKFQEIVARGPDGADDLRTILSTSNSPYLVADAAEALGKVGTAPHDVKLLGNALGRVKDSDSETQIRIRDAIGALEKRSRIGDSGH